MPFGRRNVCSPFSRSPDRADPVCERLPTLRPISSWSMFVAIRLTFLSAMRDSSLSPTPRCSASAPTLDRFAQVAFRLAFLGRLFQCGGLPPAVGTRSRCRLCG